MSYRALVKIGPKPNISRLKEVKNCDISIDITEDEIRSAINETPTKKPIITKYKYQLSSSKQSKGKVIDQPTSKSAKLPDLLSLTSISASSYYTKSTQTEQRRVTKNFRIRSGSNQNNIEKGIAKETLRSSHDTNKEAILRTADNCKLSQIPTEGITSY